VGVNTSRSYHNINIGHYIRTRVIIFIQASLYGHLLYWSMNEASSLIPCGLSCHRCDVLKSKRSRLVGIVGGLCSMLIATPQRARNYLVSRFFSCNFFFRGCITVLSSGHGSSRFPFGLIVNWYSIVVGNDFLGHFIHLLDYIWEGEVMGGGGFHIFSFFISFGSTLLRFESNLHLRFRVYDYVNVFYGGSQSLSLIIVDTIISSRHPSLPWGPSLGTSLLDFPALYFVKHLCNLVETNGWDNPLFWWMYFTMGNVSIVETNMCYEDILGNL
jgi:hypothetical protein